MYEPGVKAAKICERASLPPSSAPSLRLPAAHPSAQLSTPLEGSVFMLMLVSQYQDFLLDDTGCQMKVPPGLLKRVLSDPVVDIVEICTLP